MKVKIDNGDKLYRQIGWYLVDDNGTAIRDNLKRYIGGGFENNEHRNHLHGAQLEAVGKIKCGKFQITIDEDGSVSLVLE